MAADRWLFVILDSEASARMHSGASQEAPRGEFLRCFTERIADRFGDARVQVRIQPECGEPVVLVSSDGSEYRQPTASLRQAVEQLLVELTPKSSALPAGLPS